MSLQRDAPLPLSQQLAGLLRAEIQSGERSPGSRLPTIMQLSQEHGVADRNRRQSLADPEAGGTGNRLERARDLRERHTTERLIHASFHSA